MLDVSIRLGVLNPRDPYTKSLREASPDPEKHFAQATSILGGAE